MKLQKTTVACQKCVEVSVVCLLIMQIALFPLSWLATLISSSLPIRSMISGEGIRWLCGRFVANVQQPLLVYLVLAAFAWGIFSESGLLEAIRTTIRDSRTRHGAERLKAMMPLVAALLAISTCALLLALEPPTALLSVDGGLCDSALSRSLVPMVMFGVVIASVFYGIRKRTINKFGQVLNAFYNGLHVFAPVFLLYLLAIQFYFSILFVFFPATSSN